MSDLTEQSIAASKPQRENEYNSYQTSQHCARETQEKKCNCFSNQKHRRFECSTYFMRGYVILCCIAGFVGLLSILLLHSLSSIWFNHIRIPKPNEELVYITVALAAASASLNFFAMAIFGIQIYLTYTDEQLEEYRILGYLHEVATIRFIATFAVFTSIPVFLTSLSCYIYMEFHPIAALIATTMLGVTSLFIIYAVTFSYYKWTQTQSAVLVATFKRKLDAARNEYSGEDNPIFSQESKPEENDGQLNCSYSGARELCNRKEDGDETPDRSRNVNRLKICKEQKQLQAGNRSQGTLKISTLRSSNNNNNNLTTMKTYSTISEVNADISTLRRIKLVFDNAQVKKNHNSRASTLV